MMINFENSTQFVDGASINTQAITVENGNYNVKAEVGCLAMESSNQERTTTYLRLKVNDTETKSASVTVSPNGEIQITASGSNQSLCIIQALEQMTATFRAQYSSQGGRLAYTDAWSDTGIVAG